MKTSCAIYKGHRKADTYLYVERRDDFARVPAALRDALGELQLVMELELARDTRLARADAAEVQQQLRDNGYYLQLPPRQSDWFERLFTPPQDQARADSD